MKLIGGGVNARRLTSLNLSVHFAAITSYAPRGTVDQGVCPRCGEPKEEVIPMLGKIKKLL